MIDEVGMTRLAFHLRLGINERELADRFHCALWFANNDLLDSFSKEQP